MNKYIIEKFEKSQKKSYKDVKMFDVARFEYGDYDNWVNAIMLELKPIKNNKILEIKFCTAHGQEFIAYDFIDNNEAYFTIIGKAIEIIKDEEINKN